MQLLTDKQLVDAYKKASELHLDKDFLYLLEREITRRQFNLMWNYKDSRMDSATNK
ncbi:sporulation histidine kinase inhibitor Sda [Virgibacillus sp. SK37]|uniref:sporulation histidine kinase inhibitor Sda n=1 Tax=Virgibacillus sp. SK37 TaxID=403957 RepID=UPI0004D16A90|nr:sporulation histidine kinase inhibitor Sda [Virgibacillus sp. SK37]AIF44516.1 sporulation protein [Virgibacillus sp. SK37]